MIEQIEIIQSVFGNYVTFRDLLSVCQLLTGNVYHRPTITSWNRLLRLMSDETKIKIELIPDGHSAIIIGWRVHPRKRTTPPPQTG